MKNEISYLSYDKKTDIRAVIWDTQIKPIAVLQISHGMSEYIDRYDAFAEYCCSLGFVVCGDDHLGHGKTAADERDLGYIAQKNGDVCLVEDTKALCVIMKEKYPELPYAILGHSMGSFIVRAFLAKYASYVDCAVIMGTTGAKLPYSAAILLSKAICTFKGEYYNSPLLYNLTLGGYNKEYTSKDCLGCEWLSRDENTVISYYNDPKCGFGFAARSYGDLFRLIKSISDKRWYNSIPDKFPMLLVSGECDPVGECSKGVKRVYDKLVANGCERVELKFYTGARHELLNETNRSEVYEDITRYIRKVLSV